MHKLCTKFELSLPFCSWVKGPIIMWPHTLLLFNQPTYQELIQVMLGGQDRTSWYTCSRCLQARWPSCQPTNSVKVWDYMYKSWTVCYGLFWIYKCTWDWQTQCNAQCCHLQEKTYDLRRLTAKYFIQHSILPSSSQTENNYLFSIWLDTTNEEGICLIQCLH